MIVEKEHTPVVIAVLDFRAGGLVLVLFPMLVHDGRRMVALLCERPVAWSHRTAQCGRCHGEWLPARSLLRTSSDRRAMEVFGDSDMRKGSGHSQGGLIPGPGQEAVNASPDRGTLRDRAPMSARAGKPARQ